MTQNPPRRAAEPTPVAGGESHIRPEWVGDAAESIAGYRVEDGDYSLTVSFAEAHDIAERALAAVVPAIQAQALRDAAEAVYGDERAEGPHSHPLSIAGWLRDRALRAERGGLP